ncbi:hypothetical protein [Natrinema salaciae]|uniref:Uncharacterized protein n=1 Tax=Natrinema salaciae TaxID=1186196 RepID=A0A1H9LWK7_9EURY|nr:hypothetical protein [Natrinema salaciae]SER15649.1 hypothetical protein SAMN04489841_3109 [Natrinema salaciae]
MTGHVDVFRTIEGTSLRFVVTVDALEYTLDFVRDDLEDAYSEQDLDHAYRNLIANQVSADDFKHSLELGALECQILFTDVNIGFLFPSSRYNGLFVAFDRQKPFPVLEVVDRASTIPHLLVDTDTETET